MELKRLSFIAKLVATGSLSLFIKPIASFAASSGKRVTSEEMAGLKGFQTKSGLKFVDLLDGIPNTKPKYGQLVTFHYNGYFRPAGGGDLELFDSSYLENQPYLIKHGNSRLIRGLDEAIHTMNIGGKRRAIIPNSLGYKEIGLGPVPITPAR